MGFFVLVFGLFLINREKIHDSIESVRRQMDSPSGMPALPDEGAAEDDPGPAASAPDAPEPPAAGLVAPGPAAAGLVAPGPAASVPTAPEPAEPRLPAPEAPAQGQPAASQPQPAAPGQAGGSPPAAQAAIPAARPVTPAPETRERALYFTQVDREGTILKVKVLRKLPVSDSPMVDSMRALINGPDTDETRRGLISLIPRGTSVLNATVRGSTAYVSLSEDFQFNTHGVEGYAASLRQIVWTVTEFPNVKDVQILIEGRPLDYLGEGIWIGSPLGRETVP